MQRFTTGLISAVLLIGASASPADAQVYSGYYSTYYSPYNTYYSPYTTYYAPYTTTSYYVPYTTTSYYAPTYGYRARSAGWRGIDNCCRPVTVCDPCNPCGSCCSPCGVGCSPGGNCPGGNCSVQSGAARPRGDNWKSTPDDSGQPKTFQDDVPEKAPDDTYDGPGAPGESGGAPFDPPGGGGGEAEGRESLKPPIPVPQRGGAPITEPESGRSPAPSADDKPDEKKSNDAKADDKTAPGENGELFFPAPLDNFDEKVTWRVRPVRQRLTIRSRFPTPSIARVRVNTNQDWVPVSAVAKIVRK